ncbi:uncharacterized protein LOC134176420 [Corticium candelabrum]|uniref:uncharacterized protein LOC134176420 n=1 Tax=Corticium candelabrum TaxID=121492 RepID=UPI002E254B53|nr:uncharacterized protein LOC134176420 [Corticium candelabrum]
MSLCLRGNHYHVLVLCNLHSELEAVRRVFENTTDSEFVDAHNVIIGLRVCHNWNKTGLAIALIAQPDVGAKACTCRLFELLKGLVSFDVAVLIGVCSTVENVQEGVEYGTVIVARSTSTEEGGKKLRNGEFLPHGDPEKIDNDVRVIIQRVIDGSGSGWLDSIPPSERRASPPYVQEMMLNDVLKNKDGVNKKDLFIRLKSEETMKEMDKRILNIILKRSM